MSASRERVAAASARAARLAAPPTLAVPSATGIDAHVIIAGPGARSIAFVIDFLIRTALTLVYMLLAGWLLYGSFGIGGPEDDPTFYLVVATPAAAIYFLYHLILEPVMRGRTPGKRIVGIRVVTPEGLTPSTGALLTRNLFRIIDSMPVLYMVGLLFVMFGRRHLRLGDLAAGTLLAFDRVPFLEKLDAARGRVQREAGWSAARLRGAALSPRRGNAVEEALTVVDDYRRAARDLAVARGAHDAATARDSEHLEAVYADLHDTIHRPARRLREVLLELFRDRVPAALGKMRLHLAAVALLFVVSGVMGFWLIYTYPDLIQLFASEQMIATVERGELWTDGLLNVVPSSVVSVRILSNNIVVSIFTFCSGVIFGLGTFYLVGLNALLLGVMFAFTAQHGLADRLFDFVVAHGCVELSCICIAGAAGSYIGEALVRPGDRTRAEAFRRAASESLRVLAVVTLLLFIAGFIEGYVSPDPEIPRWARVTIGVGYWLFMISLLRGHVFGRSRKMGTFLVS